MPSMQAIFLAMLPTYLIILIGAAARATKLIRHEHEQPVMHAVFHLIYPCFILDKILGSNAFTSASDVLSPLFLGFTLPLIGIGIGMIGAKILGLKIGTGSRTFALSAGVQNFGYTAIPVLQPLWPAALPILFVHNLGVESALWSIGIMLISQSTRIQWKSLINGPIIAVTIGLILVLTKADQYIPKPVTEAVHLLGAGAFPIALVVIGAITYELLKTERPQFRIISLGVFLRLALIPALILATAKFLPIPLALKQVLIVQAAMPSGMTAILFSRIYGGRPGIAAQLSISTLCVGAITLPYVIYWGTRWIL